jgi:hypothetical protein
MLARPSILAPALIALRVLPALLLLSPLSMIAAAWSSPAAAAEPMADLRGIFVDSVAYPIPQEAEARLAEALQQPGVDGLVLVLGWNSIEPERGSYQWTRPAEPQWLDQWIGRAIASGKKVELSLRSDKSPDWLPAAGVRTLPFTYAAQAGAKPCRTETIPLPWDPGFLREWDAMLAALSAHLKSTVIQGVREYDAVVLLRLTGMDRNSDELHLPSQTPRSERTDCGKGTIQTWQSAGYKPSRLLQGWDAITSSFKTNFSDKSFSVAIIASTNPFPPIAEDGSVITKTRGLGPAQNGPLLQLASLKFPGHLVIQNNSLYAGVAAQPETVHSAQSLGTMIAFQTNLVRGVEGGASCHDRKSNDNACSGSEDYLDLLNTGIYPAPGSPLRAQYIEVFAPNVIAFPEAIKKAHDELFAPPSAAPPNPKIHPCPSGRRFCN